MTAGKLRVPAWPILAKLCECRELQLHYPHAVSDLRVCGYGDMQLQVRVSSYPHVALLYTQPSITTFVVSGNCYGKWPASCNTELLSMI